jgi:hypothetical protein
MNKNTQIAVVVGLVNLAINMAENITHYSVGKSNGGAFKVHMPTKSETMHMLFSSVVTSVLVALIVKHVANGSKSAYAY